MTLNPILRKDIDARFTEVMVGYAAQGYTFATSSMNVSYSDRDASVTLVKGKNVVVIYLSNEVPEAETEDDDWYVAHEGLSLVVADGKLDSWGHSNVVKGSEKILNTWFRHWRERNVFYASRAEAKATWKMAQARRDARRLRPLDFSYLNTDAMKRKLIAMAREKDGLRSLKPRQVDSFSIAHEYCYASDGKQHKCTILRFFKNDTPKSVVYYTKEIKVK